MCFPESSECTCQNFQTRPCTPMKTVWNLCSSMEEEQIKVKLPDSERLKRKTLEKNWQYININQSFAILADEISFF